jgi:hypothetical protein
MRLLAEGATLLLGTNLLLWHFSPPLAPPVPTETSKTSVSSITRVEAAEVIARGMTPLLSFADFTSTCARPKNLRSQSNFLLNHLRVLAQNLRGSVCFPLVSCTFASLPSFPVFGGKELWLFTPTKTKNRQLC